jgi:hypothetical protein
MLAVKPAVLTTIAACELTPLPMPEVPTGAAALIEDAGAQWLVVAVCMPWRFDSPALPPRAARERKPVLSKGTKSSSLDAAITRLRAAVPDAHLLLGGDSNQTLAGHVVRSHRGRAVLR